MNDVTTTTYDEVLASLGLEPSGDSSACGTPRGYARHRYYGEDPCQACRDANTAYKRERHHAPKPATALPPIDHGTPGGARQHWYRRETPCADCKAAYNEANRDRWRQYDRTKRNRLGPPPAAALRTPAPAPAPAP